MNPNQPTNDLPISDDWAELLSAYHDGELSAAERADVESRLTNDLTAQRWLADLGSLGSLCQELIPASPWRDVSKQVLAEAQRRKADAIEQRPLVASPTEDRPLEPEGEFGLPFGNSSRGWVWAGVAAAAAIMIGYIDRPTKQTTPTVAQHASQGQIASQTTPVALGIDRMRKAVPGLRVVRLELTPEGRKQFVQSLARNGFGFESGPQPSLPQELAAVRRAGLLVEPLARGPLPNEENDDQLMFVSAEAPRYSRLIQELEKDANIYRVEADPIETSRSPSKHPTPEAISRSLPTGSAFKPRVICFRLDISPQIGAAPNLKITPTPSSDATQPTANNNTVSSQNKDAVRGEEALPDTTIADNKEVARRQDGRVPVVFIVKIRTPQGIGVSQ